MFVLDSRLQQDTFVLGELPLSRVLLSNDARYPWFILVPRREEVSEVFQLSAEDQRELWAETALVGEVLKDAFKADKINIATLGNVVSQLHMHVIVRYRSDDAWPAPVWGRHPARLYEEAQVVALRDKLRSVMPRQYRSAEV